MPAGAKERAFEQLHECLIASFRARKGDFIGQPMV
jgi:hypothetical protein